MENKIIYQCDRGCCKQYENGQGVGVSHPTVSAPVVESTTLKVTRIPLYLCHVCLGAYANYPRRSIFDQPYCITCNDRGWIT